MLRKESPFKFTKNSPILLILSLGFYFLKLQQCCNNAIICKAKGKRRLNDCYSSQSEKWKQQEIMMSEAYSEPCQTSNVEFFCEKMPLTIFTKNYILDVWQGSENAFGSILKIYFVSEIARLGNCMRQRVLNVNSFFPIPYKTNL